MSRLPGFNLPAHYGVAAPSVASFHSYASTTQSVSSIPDTGTVSDHTTADGNPPPLNETSERSRTFTRVMLSNTFPLWGGLYEDIKTLATCIMLVRPLPTLWSKREHIHSTHHGPLLAHPLYQIAYQAMQSIIDYGGSPIELPPAPGMAYEINQIATAWLTLLNRGKPVIAPNDCPLGNGGYD